VNMTPRESLHEYALMVLRYETVYRALFENRAVRGFLAAIPGLDAYSMLGKAWWHTTETVCAGAGARPKYDLVILDGPASGHAITMLKIPSAIIAATPAGPLARDAGALLALLGDPTRASLVIVTRPEELPASETAELARAARTELHMPLGPVVVNATPPDRLSVEPVAGVLDRLRPPTGDAALDATLAAASAVRTRRRGAEAVFALLRRDPGLPLVTLPWLPLTDLGPREIERLAAALRAQVGPEAADAIAGAAPPLPAVRS